MPNEPKIKIPELEGVGKIKIDAIDEKLKRCYSRDRFQTFQKAVKDIMFDNIPNLKEKIKTEIDLAGFKTSIKNEIRQEIKDDRFKSWSFWLPLAATIIGIIVMALIAWYK
ncbi:hypothetical protein ACFLZ0_01205 [Patescibacteria group bacterium]